MGICRDSFGNLSYTMISSDKKVFSVTKGDNRIIEHMPYMNTTASIWIEEEMAFFEECPQFDSFIKAVAYLKANIEYLL